MKGERTQGAVDLARLGIAQKEIARRVQRTQQAVSHWVTGRRRPGGDERAALKREFGIDVERWETPVNGAVVLLHV